MTLKDKQLYSNRLILDYPFHWTELTKDYIDANIQCSLESSLLTQSIIRKSLLNHYYYFQDLLRIMSQSLGCPIAMQSIAFAEAAIHDLAHYESHSFQHLSLLSDGGRISIMLSDAFLSSFIHYALGCVGKSVLSVSMTARERKIIEIFSSMFFKSFQSMWGQPESRFGFHWDSNKNTSNSSNYKHCFFMVTFTIDGGDPLVIGSYYDPKTVVQFSKDLKPDYAHLDSVALGSDAMSKIPVRMKGVLSNTRMTMSDLTQLQVGDVIALPTHLDDSVSIEIGGTRFEGVLGQTKRVLAIKLLSNQVHVETDDEVAKDTDAVGADAVNADVLESGGNNTTDGIETASSDAQPLPLDYDEKPSNDPVPESSESEDAFSWDDINDSIISSIDDNDNDLESTFWLEDHDSNKTA